MKGIPPRTIANQSREHNSRIEEELHAGGEIAVARKNVSVNRVSGN